MDDERALAADAGLLAEDGLELVVEVEAGERELELGADLLVAAQDVALPQPRRGARDLAAVQQRDIDAARVELPGGGDADDPGADDRDLE
jgi:hypothetical protein